MRSLVQVSPRLLFLNILCLLSSAVLASEIQVISDQFDYSNRVWFEENGATVHEVHETYSGRGVTAAHVPGSYIWTTYTSSSGIPGDAISYLSQVWDFGQTDNYFSMGVSTEFREDYGYDFQNPTFDAHSRAAMTYELMFKAIGDDLIFSGFNDPIGGSVNLLDQTTNTNFGSTNNLDLINGHEYLFTIEGFEVMDWFDSPKHFWVNFHGANVKYVSAPASFFLYAFGLLALFRKAKSFKKSI